MLNLFSVKTRCEHDDCVGHKSNNSAAEEVENCAPSQSVIGGKNLVRSREAHITPNNRRLPMDARKVVIGPLVRFRLGAVPNRAAEDRSRAASQSAIGKKKLVRSVRRPWPAE